MAGPRSTKLIPKQRMYAMYNLYKGRYQYMIDSIDLTDQANAEACRIATRAWQTIASQCMNPDFPDFRIENVIDECRSDWEKYMKTGIPQYDNHLSQDAIIQMVRENFVRQGSKPLLTATQAVSALVVQDPPTDVAEFDSSGRRLRKPRKAAEPVSEPKQPEVPKSPEVNQLFLDNINPRSIDEVIEIIQSEFGLMKQEAEIASATIQHS